MIIEPPIEYNFDQVLAMYFPNWICVDVPELSFGLALHLVKKNLGYDAITLTTKLGFCVNTDLIWTFQNYKFYFKNEIDAVMFKLQM